MTTSEIRRLDSSTSTGRAALFAAVSVNPVEVLAREHLPEEILRALLDKCSDPDIAQGVAQFREEPWALAALPVGTPSLPHNPHTPPDKLRECFAAFPHDPSVLAALAANPNSDDELLMSLGIQMIPVIAASRYSYSPKLMQYIAQHNSGEVVAASARNWRTNALQTFLRENPCAVFPPSNLP